MGRQIAIKLSREKEIEFSNYLKSNKIKIISPLCEEKKLYFLKDIPPNGPYLGGFYLWNKKFKYNPKFTEIKKEYRTDKYHYILHTLTSPLIEFSRFEGVSRIYWDRDFGISGREYDIEEFEKWYNEVVKWIKKNCKYINGAYIG